MNAAVTFSPRRQVLLVEDDPYAEMVLSRVLKRVDPSVEVTWLKTAEEAQLSVAQNRYDLIIADIFLDGPATGLDFWHQCESDLPWTPFVVTSGLPLQEFFKAVGRTEISPPYLLKPFNLNECTETIKGLLVERARA